MHVLFMGVLNEPAGQYATKTNTSRKVSNLKSLINVPSLERNTMKPERPNLNISYTTE